MHWTPVSVATLAADFLAHRPGSKIIDIGSGAGKFCTIAAHRCQHSEFHGVEQRFELHQIAQELKKRAGLPNLHFMHGDFTQLPMENYTGIYLYNPFAENIFPDKSIDQSIVWSPSLYNYYADYMYRVLEDMRQGTRIAGYYIDENEIPIGYDLMDNQFMGQLKFWIKR